MKTKYKITKEEVIKAILTEPLISGKFFNTRSSKDNGKCGVCAVGAILRKTKNRVFNGLDAAVLTNYMYTQGSLEQSYRNNNFLSILSCEFEYANNVNQEPKFSYEDRNNLVKTHCLNVIEAFCPEVLEFEVYHR